MSTHVLPQHVFKIPRHEPPQFCVVPVSLPETLESFPPVDESFVVPESLLVDVSGVPPESFVGILSSSPPASVPVAQPVANAQPTMHTHAIVPTKRMRTLAS
jgi:hypothetical protein